MCNVQPPLNRLSKCTSFLSVKTLQPRTSCRNLPDKSGLRDGRSFFHKIEERRTGLWKYGEPTAIQAQESTRDPRQFSRLGQMEHGGLSKPRAVDTMNLPSCS